ncbi:GntR family transcriptional regulator [Pseudorhodoferax sp.]|uniref:GntR family transcriptional regulator n=1 Tax=Pseudorhodoferax sp. TaxID=1993553 RepID=UPI002DD66AB8|nr:GntR family transcriptional regulator [Pseudorhodoferax sp.]
MAKRSFQPVADEDGPRTLTEEVCTRLREDIMDSRLAPGSRLRVEHLRQHYGVGAGTLREALTRLTSDGLVLSEGQRGFRVAPIALDELRQLTQLRVHVEVDALRQAVRAGDADWRARVSAAYEALSALEQPLLPQHARAWEAANARFHEALVSSGPARWTLLVVRQLAQHSERYRRIAIRLMDQRRDVHAEHAAIYAAAMAGNELRAALALEAHIGATAELVAQALDQPANVTGPAAPAPRPAS